jgi:hypothetical protein
MKVDVYTFCYNEMVILPFLVDYWKKYADHVYIYDNGSTDGSIEFLEKFDWITVRTYETEGGKDNSKMKEIRNEFWKDSRGKADLVVVCDTDEVLCGKNLRESLQKMLDEECTICKPIWYTFVSETKPVYETGKLLHENYPLAMLDKGKVLILDPNKITESGYGIGAHTCSPKGDVKYYEGGDIFCLHISSNLGIDYKLEKYKRANARRSPQDIKSKHGVHYAFSEERLRADYKKLLQRAVDFSKVVS